MGRHILQCVDAATFGGAANATDSDGGYGTAPQLAVLAQSSVRRRGGATFDGAVKATEDVTRRHRRIRWRSATVGGGRNRGFLQRINEERHLVEHPSMVLLEDSLAKISSQHKATTFSQRAASAASPPTNKQRPSVQQNPYPTPFPSTLHHLYCFPPPPD